MFDFLRKKLKNVTQPKEKPEPEPIKPEQPKPKPEPQQKPKAPKAFTQKVKEKFTRTNIDELSWELELALLEGDVSKPVAEEICENLKNSQEKDLNKALKQSLTKILSVPSFDIVQKAKESEKPFKIMFVGPNGAGKTLTLAKIAFLLKQNDLTSVFAASDTFRAASIEQLEEHAKRLDMRVVKHSYGSDPAAVAFDAVKSAKAKGIDCVLIDTAGRQETNKNLVEELKKINRVVQPDLRLYVDEALAGHVLPERAMAFKEAVGVDGVILTKMDADVKGGGAISVAHMIKAPVLFFGMGQDYPDLKAFNAEEIVNNIVS